MYDPKGNSREKAADAVLFQEVKPPADLRGIVHRFLEVKTDDPLAADYRFHALPDACTYAIFDQMRNDVAGITKLRASAEELNLGRAFHFVNIRFLPGVWQQTLAPVSYALVDQPYTGPLALAQINRELSGKDLTAQIPVLIKFVKSLITDGLVVANPVTERIFQHIEDIHSVADMADLSGLSTRQLQRVLRQTTGLAPHDFLKVLRLQQALIGEPSLSYADQSHFIHSFRKATGYTPGKFARKFDV